MAFAIRQGDTVKVIAGKEKGKMGKVVRILKEKNRAIVEKLNMVKRHARPTQKSPQGGIIEKEASIHLSNLMFYHEKDGKTVRIGAANQKSGKKERVFKKAGKVFN